MVGAFERKNNNGLRVPKRHPDGIHAPEASSEAEGRPD
jgi:hypothetical protein